VIIDSLLIVEFRSLIAPWAPRRAESTINNQ